MGELAGNTNKKSLLIETDAGVYVVWSEANDIDHFEEPKTRKVKVSNMADYFGNIREGKPSFYLELKLGGKWQRIKNETTVELVVFGVYKVGRKNGKLKRWFHATTSNRITTLYDVKATEIKFTTGWEWVKIF